jgi:hypothetical protein
MGVVYEAEQVSLGRRVALKVLPFAATMDPRHLQRFHNEARAAASLDHPHIVPVYGVGSERGVHYYAMKLIDGQTLAGVVGRQRGADPADTVDLTHAPSESSATPPAPAAATTPGRAADTSPSPRGAPEYRRAAEWIAQAAEALKYAHALGIVHRDVKPANLMLDGQGQLWVTDFGLARVGTDAGVTMTGDVLGTLRYMSPEQALAKHGLVDHRTDIYSLGATLYELLTLRPTVDGKDREEVLRRITFEEPPAPRSVDRAIPADLETVVLKALAKEPADRYATAKELADDLRRYLGNQPVLARRPTWAQRSVKWTQRHRRLVAGGVVLLLLALACLTISTALVLAAKKEADEKRELAEKQEAHAKEQEAEAKKQEGKAKEQAERAREQEARAKAQQKHAEDSLQTSLRLVESTRNTLSRLTDNPQSGVGPEAIAEWTNEEIKVLEKLKEDHLADPEFLERLANVYYNFGDVLADSGRLTEAETAYRGAIALYTRLAADFPKYGPVIVIRLTLSDVSMRLAEAQRADSRPAAAEESYREAERLYGALNVAKGNAGPEGEVLCGRAGRGSRRPLPPGLPEQPRARRGDRGPGLVPGDAPGRREPGPGGRPEAHGRDPRRHDHVRPARARRGLLRDGRLEGGRLPARPRPQLRGRPRRGGPFPGGAAQRRRLLAGDGPVEAGRRRQGAGAVPPGPRLGREVSPQGRRDAALPGRRHPGPRRRGADRGGRPGVHQEGTRRRRPPLRRRLRRGTEARRAGPPGSRTRRPGRGAGRLRPGRRRRFPQ